MSFSLFFGWLVAMLALGLLIYSLATRKITLSCDWFFIFFYFQSLVYMNFVPMLFLMAPDPEAWSGVPDEQTYWLYAILELMVLVCFQLPLLLMYLRKTYRGSFQSIQQNGIIFYPARVFILNVFCIVFGLLYLFIMLSSGLVRAVAEYGNAALVGVYLEIPTPIFAIMRLYQYTGPFLSSLLLFIILCNKANGMSYRMRNLTLGALLVSFGSWVYVVVVNGSRSPPVLAIALMSGVLILVRYSGARRLPQRQLRILLVLCLISLYVLRIQYNIRFGYNYSNSFSIKMLNPFYTTFLRDMPTSGISNFTYRLNGLDGMVAITSAAMDQGFALGEAWRQLAYVSLTQWIDRDLVAELKLQRATDPKMYLIYRYTNTYAQLDWPNSILFDLYGNFSFLGLVLGALVFSSLFSFVRHSFIFYSSGISITVGLFLAAGTMQFEAGFASWFFGFLPVFPTLLFVILLRPFRVQYHNVHD